MRISDWSSDVCSSDLAIGQDMQPRVLAQLRQNCDIGAVVEEVAAHLVRVADGQRDLDTRMAAAEFGKDRNDVVRAAGADLDLPALQRRSEDSRVGKACVSTCRSRGGPDH